jgi:putative membrane protein
VPAILNYLLHLSLAAMLVLVFFLVYTAITPFDEVKLIRGGNRAAALSLSGALIGFALPVSSALMHTADYQQFLTWAGIAMVLQIAVYGITTALLKMARDQIEADNAAFGGLLGAISISIGVINAGGIS